MKRLVAVVIAAALIGVAFFVRNTVVSGDDDPAASGDLDIAIVCAEEVAQFCQASVDGFLRTNPEVDGEAVTVSLETLDSATAADEIADGRRRPLVWVAASSAWIDQVNEQYAARTGSDVFLKSGEYQVLPIAESPTVFVGPKPRVDAMRTHCGGEITWPCIRAATLAPGGWSAVGGDPSWGLVKVGYADPTSTNTGLLALILMSYGYYERPTALTPADITNPDYVQFIRDIGISVTDFATNSSDYARAIVTRCPSFYDIALAYEFVAATSVHNATGRGCELEVDYPTINVNSDFPLGILVTKDSTATQKDAALALRDYFYSERNQRRALQFGLRPTNPDVAIVGTTANPLADNQPAGIELVLPRAEIADYPTFDVVSAMLQTWKQKVQTP